ncbi:MAG TPA: DUF222 domain-containing protein [Flexivirga sp.]|uniref:HNH endonuclease n=1 Tax=Flexivirga sp. TaxID=1962927 RepID=UPI002C8E4DFD|nr:DUF222 domain-containing protein [Flexivirga sp.]HWC22925.1 DUF222 domain-containing protein [Flexivirga sp.]
MDDTLRHATGTPVGVLDASAVRAFHDRLDAPITTGNPWAEVRALEELRNAISARQARAVVAATEAQRACDVPRGVEETVTSRKVGADVGFARRGTPHAGSVFLNVARVLTADMPHTLTALAAGVISEWDATRLVRETAGLSGDGRAAVDAAIADQLGQVAASRLISSAREHAYRAEPDAVRARRVRAESGRRVTVRPAPDCMAYLTAFLPVKDALACMAALNDAADEAKAAADDASGPKAGATSKGAAFSRARVMADTLVERVAGRRRSDPTNVSVNLLMPLDTLAGDTPGHVPGYGPVPADLVREWFTRGDPTGPLVRRLFTYPGTGDIVGMESKARRYPGLLALLILLRDQVCRTPWCGAPVRHTDHIRSHATGGATSERNGEGLCARCNYIKEHPDRQVTGDGSQTTTESAGFTVHSYPPAPPGMPPPTRSALERWLMEITWPDTRAEQTGTPPGQAATRPDEDAPDAHDGRGDQDAP